MGSDFQPACSGYAPGGVCKHGFPTLTAACYHGMDGAVPFCLSEAKCARLWPETGGPPTPEKEKPR